VTGNRIVWLSAADPPDAFPAVEQALDEPDGLLAAGGDLSTPRLLAAYRAGIFPWYEKGQPILWWSPDPRCVLLPAAYHLARRMRRTLRQCDLEIRFDTAFELVIRTCAAPRRSQRGTWITPDMLAAFERLHAEGWAHSAEVWNGDELVGGLYGLCIGRVFFGESMFSAVPNASKIVMLALVRQMIRNDMELLDCQVVSPHLVSLGATTIPRRAFIDVLDRACHPSVQAPGWPTSPTVASALIED
jgi:leucyl/phenylalanyl-tRNA---protein transferase